MSTSRIKPFSANRRVLFVAAIFALLVAAILIEESRSGATPRASVVAQQAQVVGNLGKHPPANRAAIGNRVRQINVQPGLSFEANRGQSDPRVKFMARGTGSTIYLTGDSATVVATSMPPIPSGRAAAMSNRITKPELAQMKAAALTIRFTGGVHRGRVEGENRLPGMTNYFIGKDAARWHSAIPNYARVRYRNVYPGVDVVYYGQQRELEFDLELAPRANPANIEMQFDGASRIKVDDSGDLVLGTGSSQMLLRKPAVYQIENGKKKALANRYRMLGRSRVGIEVASYDRRKPLVIDPVLTFSTYLGGSAADAGLAVTSDSSGNAYLTGFAFSTNFPGVSASVFQETLKGSGDAFVSKFNSSGTLVYSTYLGGSNFDEGLGIAVDSTGAVYVAGETYSPDFPVNEGQSFAGTSDDAFVAKISPDGSSRVFAIFLGGATSTGSVGGAANVANSIAIPAGCSSNCTPFVTGQTTTSDFPVTTGAYQTTYSNIFNAFVTNVSADGSQLLYSTYYSGGGTIPPNDGFGTDGISIAVDGSGDAFVTGIADIASLTPTVGGSYNGGADCFVVEFNSSGSNRIFARYLGGIGYDQGDGIALEPGCESNCNSYVAGFTWSTDFPTTAGAFQTVFGGFEDAFVTELNSSGAIVYSTYLGDAGADGAEAISVDSSGNAYVTGFTTLVNFPQANALQGPSAPFFQLFKATDGATFNPTAQTTVGSALLNISIDPTNTSTIYAGTNRSGILKSTDGGASFSPTGLTGQAAGAQVDLNVHTTVYAGTLNGLSKSVDSGATFTATALTGQPVDAIAQDPSTSPTTIYAGTRLNGVMKSIDAGASFQVVPGLPNTEVLSLLVDPQSPQNLYAGTGNGLFRTTNFHPTGAMNVGRLYFPLALLEDGTVLVSGGEIDASADPTAGAEVYNPTSGSWTSTTGSMSTPRFLHTATTLPTSGNVLVAGGEISAAGAITQSADLYDPSTETFSPTGNMNEARATQTATLLSSTGTPRDGDVLIVGGSGDNTAELYNPTNGTFTFTTGTAITAREEHTATLLNNGMVLIAGGVSFSTGEPTVNAELYNPATDTFTATGNLQNARFFQTATLLNNGEVLLTGGATDPADINTGYLTSAELYDPTSGTFSMTGNMTLARLFHGAALLTNGNVLVGGGVVPSGAANTITTTAELYDVSTGVFAPATLMSAFHISTDPAIALNNGKVLWTGGFTGGTPESFSELYDPNNNTFLRTEGFSPILSMAADPTSYPTVIYGSTQFQGLLQSSGGFANCAGCPFYSFLEYGTNGEGVVVDPTTTPGTIYFGSNTGGFNSSEILKSTDAGAMFTAISPNGTQPGSFNALAVTPGVTGTIYAGDFEEVDSFVTQLNPAGSNALFSTYLGGSKYDVGTGISANPGSTFAYVTGYTDSPDFNGASSGEQPALAGSDNAFLANIDLAATPTASPTATATATATTTATATASGTPTATATRTATATATATATETPTATATATTTGSATPTATATATPSATLTATPTPTGSATATPTATATSTRTATATATTTSTATATATVTSTATATQTVTSTATGSATPTATATATPSATLTATPSSTGSATTTPTATATATATQTATPTATATATPTASATVTATATPTLATATPTATATGSGTPTSTQTATRTATATVTATLTVTATATPTPTSTAATPTTSATATLTATATATATTTATPTPSATATRTATPTSTATPVGPLNVSPLVITFKTQKSGTTSKPKTLELSNPKSNKGEVVITGINFGTTEFAVRSNTCGASISVGSKCKIGVVFKPEANGTQPDILTISDNASNAPQQVALSGIGKDSPLTPTPTATSTLTATPTVTATATSTTAATPTATAVTATATRTPKPRRTPTATATATPVPEDLIISPPSYDFGKVTVGQDKSVTFALINSAQNGPPISFASPVAFSVPVTNPQEFGFGKGATNCPLQLAPQEACQVTVQFIPAVTGVRSTIITVIDDAANANQMIKLTGTGK